MNTFQLTALASDIEANANSIQHHIKMYAKTASTTNAGIALQYITATQDFMSKLSQLLGEALQEQQSS